MTAKGNTRSTTMYTTIRTMHTMRTLRLAVTLLLAVLFTAAPCHASGITDDDEKSGTGIVDDYHAAPGTVHESTDAARQKLISIKKLISRSRARVGVAWTENGHTYSVNGSDSFPMLSVFKMHVAIAVLSKMERECTPPEAEVHVAAEEMRKDTYSPMRSLHPDGAFSTTLAELLRFSVALSDNNACDILIRYAGGTDSITRELAALGFSGFNITETEASMHADTARCRLNVTTPVAAVRMVERLFNGNVLGTMHASLLKRIMLNTTTGADKIAAALPPGTLLAHKTGSSDRTAQGLKIADNDVGMVFLSGGREVPIAVFISDSPLTDAGNAMLTAQIAREILSF